ncbi:MAG: Ig-like domain-containing protein, partial [Sulfurovum sp.]|nr:Ig-like domain-containing protein [Sulfurovum sp.]
MKKYNTFFTSFLKRNKRQGSQKTFSAVFSVALVGMLLFPIYSHAAAVDDSFTTPSGTVLSENVLTNDSGSYKNVYQYSFPSCGQITSFYSNGAFTYDPQNCSGTVTFTYYMYWWWWWWQYDNATVTITIVGTGTPPTILNKPIPDQTATLNSNFTLDIDATEPDGDTITYTANGLPPGLSIDSTTGIIAGTPTTPGTYSVTITATDKDGSDNTTFNIIIPDATTAISDTYTTNINTTLSVSASNGILGNDTGTGISVTSHTDPANGTLALNSDGSFTYTPNPGFSGTDSFNYTITDASGTTSSTTVTITVSVNT